MYTCEAQEDQSRMADETQGGIEQVRGVIPSGGVNGAGKSGETSREVYLRVAEAFPFDIHRGIARLDQASFDALGLQPGGLIHLTGKRRTTIRVERSPEGVPGRHVIRLDGTLRDNAQVSIDERVKVRVGGASDAHSITLSAPDASAWRAYAAAIPVPASLTCARTEARPRTCLMANSSSPRRSASVRLTDSPACIGSASASAPLRRWNSISLL